MANNMIWENILYIYDISQLHHLFMYTQHNMSKI